jgi:hypothetical protein
MTVFKQPDESGNPSQFPLSPEQGNERAEHFPSINTSSTEQGITPDIASVEADYMQGETVVASSDSVLGRDPVFESYDEPRESLLGRVASSVRQTVGHTFQVESDENYVESVEQDDAEPFDDFFAEVDDSGLNDGKEDAVDVRGEPLLIDREEHHYGGGVERHGQDSIAATVPILATLKDKIQTTREERRLAKNEREQTRALELAEATQRRQQDRLAVEIAQTEAHRTRAEAKLFQDQQTQARIGSAIEQTASLFNRTSLIEQTDHLRLPNPQAINRYVWGEVGLRLLNETEEPDTRKQLLAIALEAQSDAEHLLPESSPIMSEEYQRAVVDFETRVVDTVKGKLDQLLLEATEKVYVNPFPEDGRSHREYAFDLAAQIVDIQPAEMDQLVKTRDTVVFATVVVDEETDSYTFGDIDGVSKLLDRCSTSLENVDPQCRDKRVSGLLVKKPGEDYAGGLAIEVRYAGIKPLESDDLDRPVYLAQFDVEARHVQPDVFSSLGQDKLHNYSEAGRRDPIDIRVLPLFEAHAIRNGAQPRFDHYAQTVTQAIADSRDAKSMRLSAGGYNNDWSQIGSIGTGRPESATSQQPAPVFPPPSPTQQLTSGFNGTIIDVTES